MLRLRCLALCWLLLCPGPAGAAPPPPAAARPDPVKDAYEALPEADRLALQSALIWTGDFNGAVAGHYGPRTRDALLAFAGRTGAPAASVLDPARRAALLASAEAARRAVGFSVLRDARAGSVLGIPAKLLPVRTPLADGTRYAAPGGAIVMDVVGRVAGPDALAEALARLSRDAPGRRVTYTLARPDFIVVTGEIGTRRFYSRQALGTDAAGTSFLRGFTLTYPASAAEMERITLAVAASFAPFPPPAAEAQTAPPPVPSRSPTPVPSPGTPSPPPARLAGEAVLVGPGLVLTRIPRDRCPEAEVDGLPAAWSRQDAASGLALLSVPGRRDARPLALGSGGGSAEARYALFHPGDGPTLAVASAAPDGAGAVRLPLQAADAGVVVLDGSGALAGLTAPRDGKPLSVFGVLAAARYDLAGPGQVAGFLAAAAVPVAPGSDAPASIAEASSRWRPLILPLRCRAVAATP